MGQPKPLQDQPSMDDILSSIRRIIERGEGETAAQAARPSAPQPAPLRPVPEMPVLKPVAVNDQKPPVAQKSMDEDLARTLADILPPLTSADLDAFAEAIDARSEAVVPPVQPPAPPRPAAGSMQQTPPRKRYEERFTEDDSRAFAAVGKALSGTATPAQPEPATPPRAVNDDPVQRRMVARMAQPLVSNAARQSVGLSFDALSRALDERSGRDLEGMAEDLLKPMLSEWLDNNLPTIVERLVRQEIERIARGDARSA